MEVEDEIRQSTLEECEEWKSKNIPRILRLRRSNYAILSVDESSVRTNTSPGSAWQNKETPRVLQHSGRHETAYMLGAIADDGTHLIMQDDHNNAYAFIRLLKKLYAKYGKCVIILDSHSAHTSKKVRQYVEGIGGDIILAYLPVASPHLNAIEECWRQIKNDVMAGTYFETLADLKAALAERIRTIRFNHDVFTYLERSI